MYVEQLGYVNGAMVSRFREPGSNKWKYLAVHAYGIALIEGE